MESISINKSLWIRVQQHQINFDYEGLPEKVHFTIAFNSNSDFINLHLSKNVKGVPFRNKPQIKICRIAKKDFELLIPEISLGILQSILRKVDINSTHYLRSFIIPFDDLETNEHQKFFEEAFVNGFEPLTHVKQKKKLRVRGDVEKKLVEVVESSELQETTLSTIKEFNPDEYENLKGGFIINDTSETKGLIKVNNEWYEMDFSRNPLEYLELIMGKELSQNLVQYTSDSINNIKKLRTKEECKEFEFPILLKRIEKE